jgi:competence protein ComEC
LKRTSLAPSLPSKARKVSSGGLVTRDWYLATKRISAVVEATGVWPVDENLGWIGRVHRRTDLALGYGLRPREAAVVRGMVLGDRSLIPQDLEEAFQRSGITHVLVPS